MILHNAFFYTQWPERPWAEAVVIRQGRFAAAGSAAEILPLAEAGEEVIDLAGALALPGLTDAHIHFHEIAQRRGQVDLAAAHSLEDALARIARHLEKSREEWVTGFGWNESGWPAPNFPNRHDLDRVTGDRPAIFWRSDLHAAWANTAALRRAAIDAATPPPPAGVIDHDATGEPTGILREMAINLVRSIIPPPSEHAVAGHLLAAAADLHRLGIVSVHDQRMKGHAEEGRLALRRFSRLRDEGRLALRVCCNIEAGALDHLIALGLHSGFGDEWVQLGHVKLFTDGSLGSRTAWMLEPFAGEPENRGMFLTPPAEILETIQKAHRHGCAISIHAIGDRANREVLDIFAETLAAGSPHPPALPHRIEHVQIIQPDDLPRLAQMGLTASVQPIHCTDDIASADRFWGARGQHAYAFRALLDSGATLAFGSDAPVASPNPWWGIHAAVTRQRRDHTPADGWYPGQRLSVAAALHAYTLGAAAAIGQAHQQGRIAPGYLADLVVIDRDIFTCDPADLAEVQVEMTVVGGQVVYQASAPAARTPVRKER